MSTTKYIGVTRLLNKPTEADGKLYPFAFDSDMPDHLHTSYRLMVTSDPDALTDPGLTHMITTSRRQRLEAEMEKIDGRVLMWLTVYPDPASAQASNNGGQGGSRRARLEQGPELEIVRQMEPKAPTPPTRQIEREWTPPPPPMEMDMF